MFSTASFLITLRETIEAALIIGLLLIYVSKIEQKKLRKDIWIGASLGVILSIGLAIAFQFILGGFEAYEEIIEGFSMIFAAILLTWMIIWMTRNSQNYKENLENKIEQAIKTEYRFGLISLAFISVLREGIETVIFLIGIEGTGESSTVILWSGLTGIAIAILIAIIIFLSGKRINLKLFFRITSILLILFAAGMLSHGFHELQELGWFGSESIWSQKIVWDTSVFLNDNTNEFGLFLRALFGYQDKPTWLELIVYVGYFLIITIMMIVMNRRKRRRTEITKKHHEVYTSTD